MFLWCFLLLLLWCSSFFGLWCRFLFLDLFFLYRFRFLCLLCILFLGLFFGRSSLNNWLWLFFLWFLSFLWLINQANWRGSRNSIILNNFLGRFLSLDLLWLLNFWSFLRLFRSNLLLLRLCLDLWLSFRSYFILLFPSSMSFSLLLLLLINPRLVFISVQEEHHT